MPLRNLLNWRLWIALLLIFAPVGVSVPAGAQSTSPLIIPAEESVSSTPWRFEDPDVEALVERYLDMLVEAYLAELTPVERVGQLFVVNFVGDDTSPESDIAMLVQDFGIGGVVLSPTYGNFDNSKNTDTPALVASLTNRLQALAFGVNLTEDPLNPLDIDVPRATEPALPLFVAVEQLGDDVAATSLRQNFTELPNQMTLGAAWNPALALGVGAIVGRELSAVGVNLLLGPILDVYATPRTDEVGSLGTYSYGGNAFWVSEIGSAYIAGVHDGSRERVATVARHFPGLGSVDRLPTFEVATIQDSPEAMAQTSLPPFFAVTRGGASNLIGRPVRTDALMSSHMRYSAYQSTGSGRVPPLSLSPDLRMLIEVEGLEPWREDGGLMMTTALGLPAIRRTYDPDLTAFPFRRAALDAFTAGNDLLHLGYFGEEPTWASELDNIRETITFFQTRYVGDFDFALQVDDAVRRILRTKLKLMLDSDEVLAAAESLVADGILSPTPDAEELLPTLSEISSAGTIRLDRLLSTEADLQLFDQQDVAITEAERVVQQVAREAITILYPDPLTVTDALPPPLQSDEEIVIFTDIRLIKECSTCLAEVAVGPDEIKSIILKLYGPDGTGQVIDSQLSNYFFTDLTGVLESSEEIEDDEDVNPEIMVPSLDQSTPLTNTLDVSSMADVTSTESITATSDSPLRGLPLNLPPTPQPTEPATEDKAARIERDIEQAEWILFAMLNVDPRADADSDVVKRFLRQRGEQIEGKQVIVLALQAPNFLDATEISQLSTYLGVYSHTTPFVEMAIRTLFRGIVPSGAPPVSVSGTRFDSLAERLQPDAQVQIPLQVIVDDDVAVDTSSLEAEFQDEYFADALTIQVGPIIDYNGNLVPDNTLVEFQVSYEGMDLAVAAEPALTRGGIATRDLLLSESGTLAISARSGEATTGPPVTVKLTLTEDLQDAGGTDSASVALVGPATEDNAEAEPAADMAEPMLNLQNVDLVTLLIAVFTILIMVSLLLIVQIRTLPRSTLVYNILWAVIVGLLFYLLYALGLIPGARWLGDSLGPLAAGVVVFVGMIVPLLWLQLRVEITQKFSAEDSTTTPS